MTKTVTLPYRGLRCREASCQAEIIMAATTRGRSMPLDREMVEIASEDERGLFAIVAIEKSPGVFVGVAHGLRAAREAGAELEPGAFVYRAHWSSCSAASRFRR